MPEEYLTSRIEDGAVAIQLELADLGRHRAPSIPDLLIAATAEAVGLTVLHVDKDFEVIAEILRSPWSNSPIASLDNGPAATLGYA